jgi:hypothetical protein
MQPAGPGSENSQDTDIPWNGEFGHSLKPILLPLLPQISLPFTPSLFHEVLLYSDPYSCLQSLNSDPIHTPGKTGVQWEPAEEFWLLVSPELQHRIPNASQFLNLRCNLTILAGFSWLFSETRSRCVAPPASASTVLGL